MAKVTVSVSLSDVFSQLSSRLSTLEGAISAFGSESASGNKEVAAAELKAALGSFSRVEVDVDVPDVAKESVRDRTAREQETLKDQPAGPKVGTVLPAAPMASGPQKAGQGVNPKVNL